MNPQSQGTNSPSLNLPVKRKRGRPRKDESPMHGENKTLTSGSVGAVDVDDDMVGQVVTGVIEGSFDAGYLLNVKVGSTGCNLRGVVFLPGRFSPITAANDVAPHAKMYERKEIPIPVCNPPTSFYSSGSPPGDSKQSNKQNVEFKNYAPPLPSQSVPSKPKLSISMTTEKPSGFFVGALDDKLQKNDGNLCMASSVPNQIQVSEPASQSVSVVEQMKCDKVTVLNEIMQDFGVSTMMKGPDMKMEVIEALGSEQASEPIGMVTDVETIVKESQNQHLALNTVQKHIDLIDDGPKVPKLDSNQTPVISEAENSNELCKDLIDNLGSPKKDTLFQSELELVTENTAVGSSGGNAAFVTECGVPSAAETNQPIRNVEQEDAPAVSKVATEVFYCPGLFESQPRISSGTVNDMECDVKDTMEKSVRPEFTEPQLFISAGAGSEMEFDVKDTIPPTQF